MERVGRARTGAAPYFALALGWSWAFWMLHAARGTGNPAVSPLFLLGGAGPLLAALALTHLRDAPPVRREFWLRIVDPRRIRGAWWAVALLLHPAIVALAFASDAALGGALPKPRIEHASLGAVATLVFFVFWFGPLPEEIGWRGYAQERLRARMTPLVASLVLGSVWALWHVPLFFVPDTFQAGLGFGSPRSWIFLLSMVPLSVLITWVWEKTRRSTLSAALVHFSGNLCGALLPKSDRVAALELAWLCVGAAWIAWSWRSEPPPSG